MFITIDMLIGELKECTFLDVTIQKRDKVSTIRILDEKQFMEIGILYLSQKTDERVIKCQTVGGSVFLVQIDMFHLLNQIMSVFDYFNAWERRLANAVESGCTLTELLNLSFPLIRHPLTILDANEWEIAHTDDSLKEEVDSDWTDLIEKHTSDTEKIAAFNEKYYKYFNLKYVYRIPGDIFGQGYACNLFHNHTFCGVMVMAAPKRMSDVTQSELDVMQYLCEVICNMISINSYDNNKHFPEKPFLEYLVKKDEEAFLRLSRSLEIASWKENDPKWIIFAEPLEAGCLAPMPSHSKLMFNRIEGVVTVEYETGLVFLCNIRILKGKAAIQTMLSKYLRQISYHAGTSSEFYNLTSTKRMLEQAQISLENSMQISGSINLFDNAMLPYLISMLKKLEDGLTEHPCLEVLRNYDKRFGNKLYETLFSYLLNERKISKTCIDLGIPRSTLLNRLQRIDEILDIQLDVPEVRLYILLSYMCSNHIKYMGII